MRDEEEGRKKKEEERKKKKEKRADRNKSPSRIARKRTFCYSRAWKPPLTPTKVAQVSSSLRPMQIGQKSSELKEDVDSVGPDSYIFLSDW